MSRFYLPWVALLAAMIGPVVAAAFSPYLAWRDPVYIAAGFAGIVGMGLMLFQPLTMAGVLPGLSSFWARRLHRWSGVVLLLCVVFHVAGLWITSPPDVVDALLFRSPTPFSLWGVIAMWALCAAGVFALLRSRIRVRWNTVRRWHTALTGVAVAGTVTHALLIEGTMATFSKYALSALLIAASITAAMVLRPWSKRSRG